MSPPNGTFHRGALRRILFLSAALIVYATLYPFQFQSEPRLFLEWYAPTTAGNLLDLVLNFLFFLPFGLLWSWSFQGRYSLLAGLSACFGLSLAVEISQAYLPTRFSSARDLILNTFGGFTGILLGRLPLFDHDRLNRQLLAALAKRGVCLLSLLWLVANLAPFIPRFRWAALNQAIRISKPFQDWGSLELELFLSTYILFVIWQSILAKRQLFVALLALLPILFMKLLIPIRGAGLESILPIYAAMLVGFFGAISGFSPSFRWLWLLGLSIIVWKQLYPFRIDLAEPKPFSWLPFAASFETPRALALPMLAHKCFLYWTLAWLGSITMPTRKYYYLAWLTLFFIATEFAQRWIPGRTPEITDPLIMALAAIPTLGLIDPDQGLNRADR